MLCKIVQMKGTVGIFAQPAPSLYGLEDCDMEEGIQSDLPKVTQFMEETKLKPPSTLEGAMENNRDHEWLDTQDQIMENSESQSRCLGLTVWGPGIMFWAEG